MNQEADSKRIDRFLKVATVASDWSNTELQRAIALDEIDSWNTEYGLQNAANTSRGRHSNCASCAMAAIVELQRAQPTALKISGGKLEKASGFDSVLLFAYDRDIPHFPKGADISHAFFKIKDGFVACVHSKCVPKNRRLKRSECVEFPDGIHVLGNQNVSQEDENQWTLAALRNQLRNIRSDADPADYVGGFVVHAPNGRDWCRDEDALRCAILDCWALSYYRWRGITNPDDEALFLVYAVRYEKKTMKMSAHHTVLHMIGDECISIDMQQSLGESERKFDVAQSVLHKMTMDGVKFEAPHFVCVHIFNTI